MGRAREGGEKTLAADKRENANRVARRFYIFKRNQESSLPSGSEPRSLVIVDGTDKLSCTELRKEREEEEDRGRAIRREPRGERERERERAPRRGEGIWQFLSPMTRERRREIAAESVLRSLRQSLISYLPPFFATLPHDDGERRPPFLYASIDPRYLNLCRAPFKTPKWRFIRWPPTILFSWNNLNNLALLLLLHRSGEKFLQVFLSKTRGRRRSRISSKEEIKK